MKQHLPLFFVLLACAIFSLVFGARCILQVYLLSSPGYDLGIQAQGIYLLSHGDFGLNTVRGLPTLGDHGWFIMLLLAPFQWICGTPYALLFLQACILGAGGIALYILLNGYTQSKWFSAVLTLPYLLYPLLQQAALVDLHVELFSITLFLVGFAMYEKKHRRTSVVFFIIAGLCKEDMLAGMSVYLLVKSVIRRDKVLFSCSVICLLCFLSYIKILLPMVNGFGFFRFEDGYWFSGLKANLFNPKFYFDSLWSEQTFAYIKQAFAPIMFLVFLGPVEAIFAVGGISILALSNGQHLFNDAHYIYLFTGFLFAAYAKTIAVLYSAIRRIPERWRLITTISVAILIVGWAMYMNLRLQPGFNWTNSSKWFRENSEYINGDSRRKLNKMLEMLPDNASVSATYTLLPMVCQRREVYMYPNPVHSFMFGISGRATVKPYGFEYLLGDMGMLNMADINAMIDSGAFEIVSRDVPFLLLRRKYSAEKTEKMIGDLGGQQLEPVILSGKPHRGGALCSEYESNIRSAAKVFCIQPETLVLRRRYVGVPRFDLSSTSQWIIHSGTNEVRVGESNNLLVYDGLVELEPGLYSIKCVADDYAAMYLAGKLIGEWSYLKSEQESQVQITKGGFYRYRMDVLQIGGPRAFELTMRKKCSDGWRLIEPEQFSLME